jgi:signal transduction histidine kinase/ligand-binding sensor domain-containing protein
MIRSVFSLLLLLIPIDMLAQVFTPNPDWRFENFNGQNHFVSREIPDVAMDKYGYIWTASLGVQRFDGSKTTDFNSFDKGKGTLRANYAGLRADNNGRIWVSSSGLCYYDDASGKFVYIVPDPKHSISNISGIYPQGNSLWLVCDSGLARLDLKSLKISFTSLTTIADPLSIYLVDENTLLLSSREKVYVYDIKKDSYSVHTLLYNGSLVKIFTINKKGDDVYLGTNYGLFTFQNLKTINLVNNEPEDFAIDDMLFLPQDKEKKYLFLATEGHGLLVYNTTSKKIEYTYTHDENNPFSLPDNIVSKLFIDKKERLWLATDMGISMLDIYNQQLKMRFLNKNSADELGINKIAGDKYDNSKVWMSSYNQGMICVNWKTKKVEKIFNGDPETRGIYDFVQLSKSKWLLTSQKVIMEWNPESGILVKKQLPIPDSVRLVCNIRSLIMAGANTCFITTNKGLFKYDLLTRQVSIASQTSSKNHSEILQYILLNGFYDNGTLWITSRNGLFSYNISKKTTTIFRGKGGVDDYFFFSIANAVNNQIACAAGNGIFIFNKVTKVFIPIHSMVNAFNPLCVSVIGIKNTVWAGTEAGILNYNLDTKQFEKAFDLTQMLQVFPSSSFTVIGDDIVFGFRNGYAYFTPDVKNKLIPSDPLIEKVYVNNRPVEQTFSENKNSDKLILSHLENSINIAFTAFLYNNPDQINFRYRLAGTSQGWQYAADQHSANYAQLEPGDYTFYVQSGNKSGAWNNYLASFNFVVKPPYWETWWFRMLVTIAIAFGLYRLYRYRVKNILAIERIREKIASDFHDDIGSALSSISIFSEVVDKQLQEQQPTEQTRQMVGNIASQSRAMLDAMDDIIWAVNPKNDHFNDLAVRMHEFAVPLLEARNIAFDININEDILNTQIKMAARKNIFLIFKECINNILKHSCCTVMQVSVKKINNQVELIISDNGKGFDVNAPHSRNGLLNMKKRADEIGGVFYVTTQSGKGTLVKLLVNII